MTSSRRVWDVDDPRVEQPLVKTEDSAVGCYALNGESLMKWTEDEKKERIWGVLEKLREQNLSKRILIVLDKHGSHICEYTRRRAINSASISCSFHPGRRILTRLSRCGNR